MALTVKQISLLQVIEQGAPEEETKGRIPSPLGSTTPTKIVSWAFFPLDLMLNIYSNKISSDNLVIK